MKKTIAAVILSIMIGTVAHAQINSSKNAEWAHNVANALDKNGGSRIVTCYTGNKGKSLCLIVISYSKDGSSYQLAEIMRGAPGDQNEGSQRYTCVNSAASITHAPDHCYDFDTGAQWRRVYDPKTGKIEIADAPGQTESSQSNVAAAKNFASIWKMLETNRNQFATIVPTMQQRNSLCPGTFTTDELREADQAATTVAALDYEKIGTTADAVELTRAQGAYNALEKYMDAILHVYSHLRMPPYISEDCPQLRRLTREALFGATTGVPTHAPR